MLKRKFSNESHQMLPHYEGEYKPKQCNIDFESARENLMKEDYKMVAKRRFDGIYSNMECKLYIKNVHNPENKEIFIYGFKHVKTDKIEYYTLIGCESDELRRNNKLFNFWSIKFLSKGIEKRDFKVTGWPFMTSVKKATTLKFRTYVCNLKHQPNRNQTVFFQSSQFFIEKYSFFH